MNDRMKKKAEKRLLSEKELENVNGGGFTDILKQIGKGSKAEKIVELIGSSDKKIQSER